MYDICDVTFGSTLVHVRIVYDWSTFHTFLWSYSYITPEEQVQYAEYVKKIS